MEATKSGKSATVTGLDLANGGPQGECDDPNCPFHGSLKVRENTLVGVVASIGSEKTAVIQRPHAEEIPKYNRFERRRSRVTVHLPPCFEVAEGDRVKVAECRPLSKTKSYVVVDVLKSKTEAD